MKFNICTIAVRKTTVLFAISKTFRIIAVHNFHSRVEIDRPRIRAADFLCLSLNT